MTTEDKEKFLKSGIVQELEPLKPETKAAWGKMNAWQMVEHLTNFFRVSSGKILFDIVTPEEHLPKYKEFLYSDKVFRENTKAPVSVIGEEPLPVTTSSFDAAKEELRISIEDFFNHFSDGEKQSVHPVFGSLNYNEWIMLHYKHVIHHLRQFTAPL
jgi:oxepin-CoA hydrolase/3-oxo-5,6-dehydrosuberyl-CoA semialdehyde dehydrogenase